MLSGTDGIAPKIGEPGPATGDRSRVRANLLLLSYVAFVTLGLPISMMGVAWPTLRAEFNLPLDALGLLLTSSTIGYLISSFTIARLILRFGIGALLVASSVASAVAFLGYAVAPAWAGIVLLGVLAGLGSGLMDAGLNTYLAAEYNEGEMQWLHASGGLGATLSPLLMTASLALFASWRPAYGALGGLMVVMTIIFIVTLRLWKRPNATATGAAEGDDAARGLMDYRTPMWQTLLRVVTWVSIALFLLYCGAEFTLGNWAYTVLTESRGVSPQVAGLWATGFWAMFALGRVLGGLTAGRVRLNTLMYVSMGLAFVGAIWFWWNPIALIGISGVLIVGLAMAPIFPGLISGTAARVGQRHAGNTIGIEMSAAGLGGALLPSLAGVLARRVSLETIPLLLVVSLAALLVLYAVSARAREDNHA